MLFNIKKVQKFVVNPGTYALIWPFRGSFFCVLCVLVLGFMKTPPTGNFWGGGGYGRHFIFFVFFFCVVFFYIRFFLFPFMGLLRCHFVNQKVMRFRNCFLVIFASKRHLVSGIRKTTQANGKSDQRPVRIAGRSLSSKKPVLD